MEDPITINTLIQAVTAAGLPTALLLFYVYVNHRSQESMKAEHLRREETLSSRIQAVEDFARGGLVQLVEKTVGVITDNTNALRDTQSTLKVVRDGLVEVHADLKEHHKLAQQVSEELLHKHEGES